MSKRVLGALTGFAMGFLVLHPFSMVYQWALNPGEGAVLPGILSAFDMRHLPMEFFFGAIGALFGFINTHYAMALAEKGQRLRMLEGLLPICAYCKKIRDDSGVEKHEGKWHGVEQYIAMKTDTTFTHGVCPECYEKMMDEMEQEDFVKAGMGARKNTAT